MANRKIGLEESVKSIVGEFSYPVDVVLKDWLAEHDDTPIDAEWLKSLGFAELGPGGLYGSSNGYVAMELCGERRGKPLWEITTDEHAEVVESRGTMLTHLRLWGIKL